MFYTAFFWVDGIQYEASGTYEDDQWLDVGVDRSPDTLDDEDFIDRNWHKINDALNDQRRIPCVNWEL